MFRNLFGGGMEIVFLEEGGDLELQLKELQNSKRRKGRKGGLSMSRGRTIVLAVFGLLVAVGMIVGAVMYFMAHWM